MSGDARTRDGAADPGRAAERTGLAWNRSALALAAAAGFVTKAGADSGTLATGLAGGGALLLLAVSLWAYGLVRYRRARDRRSGVFGPVAAHALLTAAAVGASVVALALVVRG